jgi:predicted protein tyrosine phosphatase
MRILFICSRNQWRSPTAEALYRDRPGLEVRSAGTEPSARIRLTAKTILWADLIFVMEKRHRQRMQENFPEEMQGKQVIVLDIPDDYHYMDPELIEEIEVRVGEWL